LKEKKKKIAKVDALFQQFDEIHSFDNGFEIDSIDFVCLRSNMKVYEQACTKFTDYSLKYVKNIAYACEKTTSPEISNTIRELCKQQFLDAFDNLS